jgi:c-di-GMP-binding flagellar brake protein YcgR
MRPVSERLAIGQRLELRLDHDWLPSRLEDRDEAGQRLIVAWPTDQQRRLLQVKVGDTLELAASAQDALYSAHVRVIRGDHDGVPLLITEPIGDWQRTQRRHAVRLPVAIRPHRARRLLDDGTERPVNVAITNISAGGLQLRSEDELRHGDRIAVTFSLMDVPGELTVVARVCRVQQELRVWVAGCALEDVSARTAEQIVQFIFARQRAELARSRKAS